MPENGAASHPSSTRFWQEFNNALLLPNLLAPLIILGIPKKKERNPQLLPENLERLEFGLSGFAR